MHISLSMITIINLFTSCISKQKSLPGFELEDGFNLSMVASEPLITDPVDLEFDAYGNTLVLEMPGYPYEDSSSKVIMLKDTNQDGKMDLAKTYAENLNMASSILPYEKGILVAAPPYLLYCMDENKDEVVDKVDTLMGGFSTGNLQHNFNGLSYGIDNWIYAANGGNSGKPYWWGDSLNAMDLRGQDFRFHIKQKKLERIGESSGGFGIAMDEYGRVFGTHNLTHVSQIVFPDRYIQDKKLLFEHTLNNISDHEENGLARVYPIGEQETRLNHPEQSGYFSGSCGITYYDGGAWGKENDQTIWVTDVVLNLIHADKLNKTQSSFHASRILNKREFLASTDRSFRPVNMKVGPDGNLYVVDMYRKVIEHPEWIPDEMEKTLDINNGKDKGRIYKISKFNTNSSFNVKAFLDESTCIASLSHPNGWVRKTAQRLLVEKNISVDGKNKLKTLANSNNGYPTLHAMWILHELGALDTKTLEKCLMNNDAGVRENAVIVAEQYLNDKIIQDKILALLVDKDDRVKMQAALSLSMMPKQMSLSLQEKIISKMKEQSVRENEWNIGAFTLAAKHFPIEALQALAPNQSNNQLISSLALQLRDSAEGIVKILDIIAPLKENKALIVDIVKQFNQSSKPLHHSSIQSIFSQIESDDIRAMAALTKLSRRFGISPSDKFLAVSKEALGQLLDPTLTEKEKLALMEIIQLIPYQQKSETLFSCLKNQVPLKIQEEALRQLSTYQEKEIGRRLIEIWSELSPSTRRFASDLLLYVDIHHDALLGALETGKIQIGEMNFDLERRRMLIAWDDNPAIRKRASKLFSDEEIISRKDVIAKMKPALSLKGVPAEGEKVFQAICSNCHRYGNIGNEVGPVLTEINRKSKESIMHEILDPNAAVNAQYISHQIKTKDGMMHIGIIDSENDESVVMKKMGGEKISFNKKDIAKMNSMGKSLMMEGLEGSISQQQMADLLSFLQKN